MSHNLHHLAHRQMQRTHAMRGKRKDTMAIVTCNATLMSPFEVSQHIQPLKQSLDAMRQGRATFEDYVRLSSSYHLAHGIEHFGVVRGLKELIDETRVVLDAIGHRGGDQHNWKPPTLYASEIKRLQDHIAEHKFQLEKVSYGEYVQAYEYAVRKVEASKGEVFKRSDFENKAN
jgi:hypothetical protein